MRALSSAAAPPRVAPPPRACATRAAAPPARAVAAVAPVRRTALRASPLPLGSLALRLRRPPPPPRAVASIDAAPPAEAQASDAWISGALERCAAPVGSDALSGLRAAGRAALASARAPSNRDEPFRFTDLAALSQARLVPAPAGDAAATSAVAASLALPEASTARVVLHNGRYCAALSSVATSALPRGVLLGPLSALPPAAHAALAPHLAAAAAATAELAAAAPRAAPAGVLPALAAACAADALVLYVPADVAVDVPIHVLHVASAAAPSSADVPFSAPRLLVVLEAGASAWILEEYATSGGDVSIGTDAAAAASCVVASVADVALGAGASLRHAYVASAAAAGALQLGCTRVTQAERSRYELAHVSLASRRLARHDVAITQGGPATSTTQRAFLLVGQHGCGDLHTGLELNHPDGSANQLHKCIAASPTARGVFDGGVRVGRPAQRTNAAQLSRNLLLAARASVAAKPNLQIVADDVACTHGCTVSDLDEESLFYFQARGVDAGAAREALVASFGAEVVAQLGVPTLEKRLRAAAADALAGARK